MSDAGGSSPSKDEGNHSGTGSPVSERLKQFEIQTQGEKKPLQTTTQRRGKRVDASEKYNKQLEDQLERAIQEKEAARDELEKVIASKPTMTETEVAEMRRLRKHNELLETQANEHATALAESVKLEGQVKRLQTQLDKAKEEVENQKEKVLHEKKTSEDYKNMLSEANKKTPDLEKKYKSLVNALDRQREDFDTKEKEFEKRISALQKKYDTQTEQNKTLDAAKKQAEIHNVNLETQVQTLAGNLQEAEAKLEQSQKDVRDIVEKAQSARQSSPSATGGAGGAAAALGQSLEAELNDAASPEGSVTSVEDTALDLATKALDELQQKASGLEADKTKIRGEVAGLQKEVDVLKEERDGLQKRVSDLQEENNSVQKQNEDLAGERDGLQSKASGLEQSNDKLQDEVAGLKKEAVDLNAEKDGLQKKASDLTNDAGKLESELQGEKDRLQKQISELQEENAGLQKKVSESTNNASQLESELQGEKARLQEQVSQLQEENAALQKKASESTNNASKLESELQGEKDRLQEEVSQLREENAALQKKASELTNDAGKLELESDLQGEKDKLQEQVSQLREENAALQKKASELTDAGKLESSLQGEKDRLQELVSQLQEENSRLQDRASELGNDAGKLESELQEKDRLQKQVSQLQEENSRLQKRASELGDETGKLEGDLKADNDRLQKQVTDLEAELEGIRKSAAELTEETIKQHADWKAEKEKLREDVANVQKQNQELMNEASNLNSSVNKVQDQLAESLNGLGEAVEDEDHRDEAHKDLAAVNDQLEAELEQALEDTKRYQELIAALEAEKHNLQEQMANSQEFDDRIGALQEGRDHLQRELQKELDAKQKVLDQAAKAQDPTSSEEVGDSHDKAVSDLLQAEANFADQIAAMEEDRQTILDELESVKQQLAGQPSAEDIANLRARLQELQQERERLVAEIARLEREKGEVEARLAVREHAPVGSNKHLDELRREIAAGNEAREELERERDNMLDQSLNILQEKLDVEARLEELEERARDGQQPPVPDDDPVALNQEIRDLRGQVDALKRRNERLHAQLDSSKERQDDYRIRHKELSDLLDDERERELNLSRFRNAANAAGMTGQSPDSTDALREEIAALNERLEEARRGREDARIPRPVTVEDEKEPSEDGEQEPAEAGLPQGPNPMLDQMQREIAEMQQTQARQKAGVSARRRQRRRGSKSKGKAREALEMIDEEPDSDEEEENGGGGEASKPSKTKRVEVLKAANHGLGNRVRNLTEEAKKQRRVLYDKDAQIENLETLMEAAQPVVLPEGAPPEEGDEDDVLTVPRADLPGQVRERNRAFPATLREALRNVRRLLIYDGVMEVKNFVAQPKIALAFLYTAIILFLAMTMAQGHRYHQWAVANDVSRAMYVNRNWYIAFVLPDFHFWEQLADMVGLT